MEGSYQLVEEGGLRESDGRGRRGIIQLSTERRFGECMVAAWEIYGFYTVLEYIR